MLARQSKVSKTSKGSKLSKASTSRATSLRDKSLETLENRRTELKVKFRREVYTKLFIVLFYLTHLLGLTCIVLHVAWIVFYNNGFSWSGDRKLQGNWHGVLMITAFVYIKGGSLIVYRGWRNLSIQNLRWIHVAFNTAMVPLMVTGLVAIVESHEYRHPPKPFLGLVHSWVGIIVISLYCFQFMGSLLMYVYPEAPASVQRNMEPTHIYLGFFIFVGCIYSAVTGLNLKSQEVEVLVNHQLNLNQGLLNLLAVLITTFGVLVIYLTSCPTFRRKPRMRDYRNFDLMERYI